MRVAHNCGVRSSVARTVASTAAALFISLFLWGTAPISPASATTAAVRQTNQATAHVAVEQRIAAASTPQGARPLVAAGFLPAPTAVTVAHRLFSRAPALSPPAVLLAKPKRRLLRVQAQWEKSMMSAAAAAAGGTTSDKVRDCCCSIAIGTVGCAFLLLLLLHMSNPRNSPPLLYRDTLRIPTTPPAG